MRATFPVEPFRIPRLATWAGWLLSGLLILYLYGVQGNAERIAVHGTSAILWMTARWSGQYATDHSFGWLIPVVSAGLVWRRRAAIAAAATTPDRRGYGGVLLALLLYWGGVQGQQTRLTLL